MEYFGINFDSAEPNIIKNFTNILKKDVINGSTVTLEELERYERQYVKVDEKQKYISLPVLYSHFDLLHFYTDKMEDNSIIKNCSTLKALANNIDCTSYKMFTIKKLIDKTDKTFYVLHVEERLSEYEQKKRKEKMHKAECFEATLTQKNDGYTIFGCFQKSIKIDGNSVNVYYTHQIDLFDNERDQNPMEAKLMYCPSNTTMAQNLSESFEEDYKIRAVLQCKIGGVKKLILGFHTEETVQITQMDLENLDVGKVKDEVSKRLKIMRDDNLPIIVKRYNNKWEGKTVKIKNVSHHTKSYEWYFTELKENK